MRKRTTSSHHKKQSKLLKKKRKDKGRQKKAKEERILSKTVEKEMKLRLEAIENMISRIPSSCAGCDANFDNTNSDHLDNWEFSSSDSGMALLCDACKKDKDEITQS